MSQKEKEDHFRLPRIEFPKQPIKTMTLNLPEREMNVLEAMAAESEMSKTAIMRQALRIYSLVVEKHKLGYRLAFKDANGILEVELMRLHGGRLKP